MSRRTTFRAISCCPSNVCGLALTLRVSKRAASGCHALEGSAARRPHLVSDDRLSIVFCSTKDTWDATSLGVPELFLSRSRGETEKSAAIGMGSISLDGVSPSASSRVNLAVSDMKNSLCLCASVRTTPSHKSSAIRVVFSHGVAEARRGRQSGWVWLAWTVRSIGIRQGSGGTPVRIENGRSRSVDGPQLAILHPQSSIFA